jgi:phage shock protein C
MSDMPGRPDERRLTRSRTNRVVAGVCAGLANYLGVDPVMIRIAFVVLALAGGGGVLIYLIAWILIPEEEPGASPSARPVAPVPFGESARLVFGAVLIAIGTILLINLIVPGFSRFFWPLALIALGVAIIVQSSAWRR